MRKTEELVVWFGIAALLVGSLAGEYKSTTDVMNRSRSTLSVCQNAASSNCDIIAATAQYNAFAQNVATVQWRRGFIGACAIGFFVPIFTQVQFSQRQSLILVLLTWVVITSLSGYNDYHMRDVANTSVNDCLMHSINLSAAAGQNCSSEYVNTVSAARERRRVGLVV